MRSFTKLGALQYAAIVGIIVAITTMVVVIPIIKETLDISEKALSRSRCATSVRQQAFANVYFKEAFAKDLDCPAEEITLKQYRDDEQTKKEAYAKIGGALLDCWNDYGRGNLNLFREEAIYCNICSFVEFKEGSKKKEYTGLNKFLATTNVPGTRTTYFEQLTGTETDDFKNVFNDPVSVGLPTEVNNDVFKSEDLYSVIYVYARGESKIEELEDFFGSKDELLMGGIGATAISSIGTAGLIFLFTPVGLVSAGVIGLGVGAAVAGATAYSILVDDPPEWLAFTSFKKFNADELTSLGCENIKVKLETSTS